MLWWARCSRGRERVRLVPALRLGPAGQRLRCSGRARFQELSLFRALDVGDAGVHYGGGWDRGGGFGRGLSTRSMPIAKFARRAANSARRLPLAQACSTNPPFRSSPEVAAPLNQQGGEECTREHSMSFGSSGQVAASWSLPGMLDSGAIGQGREKPPKPASAVVHGSREAPREAAEGPKANATGIHGSGSSSGVTCKSTVSFSSRATFSRA